MATPKYLYHLKC